MRKNATYRSSGRRRKLNAVHSACRMPRAVKHIEGARGRLLLSASSAIRIIHFRHPQANIYCHRKTLQTERKSRNEYKAFSICTFRQKEPRIKRMRRIETDLYRSVASVESVVPSGPYLNIQLEKAVGGPPRWSPSPEESAVSRPGSTRQPTSRAVVRRQLSYF